MAQPMKLAPQRDWREHDHSSCICRQCSTYRGTEAVHGVIKRTIEMLTYDVPHDAPLPPEAREVHTELVLCASAAERRFSSLLESWRMGIALPVPNQTAS
jgi:hypothetical protein